MDNMTHSYLATALWTATDDKGEPLDRAYGIGDFAPEAISKATADCLDFRTGTTGLLEEASISPEQAGHDFWLTRNRHGTGFWDRSNGRIGQELTDFAHAYGETDVYVGDSGKLYLS